PVDSVVFDLVYNPSALLFENVTSPICGLRRQRLSAGDVRITAFNCGTPMNAGNIADAQFYTMVTSSDTTYTQIVIDSVAFYPAGSVTGSGCSIPVTINPLCGLKGVIYTGATSLSQNYPNPFMGTTTIHVTLSQSDANGAQLKIYNMLSEQVADLTSQLSADGDVTFNAGASKTGVYYYMLETASGRIMRQMFVVK
ncbi:MAG TPA: T9SS type A sorting domain-containing protein, partial [Candidatus Kapabacteria bacterium]|nr:T9SS type A sorting domain-containing protein [Candidatus Kapabacteria bacterium]